MSAHSRRALIVLGLLALSLAFRGSRGLREPDEGCCTAVVLEMPRSGELLLPALHPDLPHFTEPPWTSWRPAAALALGGGHEWAARRPNSLAFAATVLVAGPGRPWSPGPVYATSLLPFVAASVVTTDTLLTLWEGLAVRASAVAGQTAECRRRRPWIAAMGASLGLAFPTPRSPGWLPLGLAAFAVAGLGGYVAEELARSPERSLLVVRREARAELARQEGEGGGRAAPLASWEDEALYGVRPAGNGGPAG